MKPLCIYCNKECKLAPSQRKSRKKPRKYCNSCAVSKRRWKSKIELVKIYIANDIIDSFNFFCHKSNSFERSKNICKVIKDNVPNSLFTFNVQAKIGSRTIASEQVRSTGKNFLSKCYGGDYSRKKKLIENQKEGKLKMKEFGKVSITANNVTKIFKQLQENN